VAHNELDFNPLNAELNPISHLLTLLRAHHILHVSRIRVKEQGVVIWIGLIWLRIDGSVGLLWTCKWSITLHKHAKNFLTSWVTLVCGNWCVSTLKTFHLFIWHLHQFSLTVRKTFPTNFSFHSYTSFTYVNVLLYFSVTTPCISVLIYCLIWGLISWWQMHVIKRVLKLWLFLQQQ